MIKQVAGGLFGELTYFYIDETTNHGFVIDPGADAQMLLGVIKEQGWTIEKILLTHGHIDHMRSADGLREALACPIVIHEEGKQYVEDAVWNLSEAMDVALTFSADKYVRHGDEIILEANNQFKLKVLHAPGHTLDGVAYYDEAAGVAFVGDIIFSGSIGRSDLPGGNMMRLLNAIRAQIFTLPDDVVLYPGHGMPTTVGREKETNPHFNFFE